MLRIQAGLLKGMSVKTAKKWDGRPSSIRVRAAIFNLLGNIEDLKFIDFFAGSGAIGIEALSRGASSCVFVENNFDALQELKKNLQEVSRRFVSQGFKSPVMTIKNVDITTISHLPLTDIIWADPPYADMSKYLPYIHAIAQSSLCSGGRLIVESSNKNTPSLELSNDDSLILCKTRSYGEARLTIWQRN